MKYGVVLFVTDETIAPAVLGPALEERGFDALFVPEHSHIPASRESPAPGGGDLPRHFYRTVDVFVTLAVVAVTTARLALGTGVALPAERDVFHTAKQVASLDLVSGGRALFGVGVGWNREEARDHGIDPRRRGRVLDEKLAAMARLWSEERAEFHGEHVDFDPVYSWPKPVQSPHPPIYVGGGSDAALARLRDHGDAWLPDTVDVEDYRRVRSWLADQGRPDVPFTVFGADPDTLDVAGFDEVGVERIAFWVDPGGERDVLTRLDAIADRWMR
ncbi:LLM class F420-dependent oxidoreductase [Actinomycetospora sp. NBRC 106375]|uniref:LLM class F420-dependent oxidoreductase n=1 Tax=Actinomycetospora sp. NBRC 106375 TaxID=3032207 RepID=UPI0024A1FFAF|nr:LLM class F420-dependent oxidoreductase [Actinomycetospora sp. NBRC 106375]GLZ48350.1 LLM class F420-dependent oxidoreductase [Actinomycetospora sp. NBRC 106375]